MHGDVECFARRQDGARVYGDKSESVGEVDCATVNQAAALKPQPKKMRTAFGVGKVQDMESGIDRGSSNVEANGLQVLEALVFGKDVEKALWRRWDDEGGTIVQRRKGSAHFASLPEKVFRVNQGGVDGLHVGGDEADSTRFLEVRSRGQRAKFIGGQDGDVHGLVLKRMAMISL